MSRAYPFSAWQQVLVPAAVTCPDIDSKRSARTFAACLQLAACACVADVGVGMTTDPAHRPAMHGGPGAGQAEPYNWASPASRSALRVQEMVIYGVSFDMVGKQPIVLLKAVDTNKFLPIWIGHPEAAAILMKLQGASTPRPMTHDLLFDMLGELEVACTRVSVTELRENTFYASITLSVNGREVEIDSRPSDALALAVRSGAPIFAAEDVIAESAIEFEHEVEDTEEVVDKFKEFLDRVTPEDFAGGDA
jgi:bifunctional DNase/RNase